MLVSPSHLKMPMLQLYLVISIPPLVFANVHTGTLTCCPTSRHRCACSNTVHRSPWLTAAVRHWVELAARSRAKTMSKFMMKLIRYTGGLVADACSLRLSLEPWESFAPCDEVHS